MVADATLQLTLKYLPLVEFWCGIKEKYPQPSEKAIKIFPSFSTIYLCEADFLCIF